MYNIALLCCCLYVFAGRWWWFSNRELLGCPEHLHSFFPLDKTDEWIGRIWGKYLLHITFIYESDLSHFIHPFLKVTAQKWKFDFLWWLFSGSFLWDADLFDWLLVKKKNTIECLLTRESERRGSNDIEKRIHNFLHLLSFCFVVCLRRGRWSVGSGGCSKEEESEFSIPTSMTMHCIAATICLSLLAFRSQQQQKEKQGFFCWISPFHFVRDKVEKKSLIMIRHWWRLCSDRRWMNTKNMNMRKLLQYVHLLTYHHHQVYIRFHTDFNQLVGLEEYLQQRDTLFSRLS